MEQHASPQPSGIVVATHHAAWAKNEDDGRPEWVAGVVQWHAFRTNPDGKTLSRTLLLDNTHFRVESYIDDLRSPFLHAIHSWQSPTPQQLLEIQFAKAAMPLTGFDRELYRERLTEVAVRTFDVGEWFRRELNDPDAGLVADPVSIALDNDIPVQLINGAPLHEYPTSMIPSMWVHGQVWPAIALIRDVARLQARVLHLAIGRGAGTQLGANKLKPLHSDERHAVEIDLSAWRSPHFSHAEEPFGDDEPKNGRFKFLIPSGRWWPELLELARTARQRRDAALIAAEE